MGRSLRRIKKHKPRIVKRGKNRSSQQKSRVPEEITSQRPDLVKKLGKRASWNSKDTVVRNYAKSEFVRDPNFGFGRNQRDEPEQLQIQGIAAISEHTDEELKVACNEQRSSGAALPKRLTPRQKQIVHQLVAAHGANIQAMMMDRNLNPMQHSEAFLNKMIESFNFWKPGSGVDFRVPNKGL